MFIFNSIKNSYSKKGSDLQAVMSRIAPKVIYYISSYFFMTVAKWYAQQDKMQRKPWAFLQNYPIIRSIFKNPLLKDVAHGD